MGRTAIHIQWTAWPTVGLAVEHEHTLTSEQIRAVADVVASIEEARDVIKEEAP